MLVELFGIPGAGKSTLVDAASERARVCTRQDLSASWRRRPLFERSTHLLRSYLQLPRSWRALRFAFHARIANYHSLRRLLRAVAKSDLMRSQGGTVLLDQGLLQELWSILYAQGRIEPDPELLSPLIRSLYSGIDARILFVDVDSATAARRIAGRSHGHSRLDGLADRETRDHLERTAELPRRIIEAARLAGLQVELVDGSAPLDEQADAVIAAVGR